MSADPRVLNRRHLTHVDWLYVSEFGTGGDEQNQAPSVKASCTDDWTEPPVTAPPPAT
jgi:hypothetical protein